VGRNTEASKGKQWKQVSTGVVAKRGKVEWEIKQLMRDAFEGLRIISKKWGAMRETKHQKEEPN